MEERRDQDVRLAEAAARGDAGAFRQLVVRYQRLVASVLWRHGTRRQDIEDLVSEVFLKLYRNLGQYRPDHPFSTWLYRLTVNHAVDHARRRRHDSARVDLPDDLEDTAPSAGEDVLVDERAALLRAALASVDTRYREALALVYVEGLKVEEAARVLAVPVGTVKTRLMRGREALRRVLNLKHPGYFETTQ